MMTLFPFSDMTLRPTCLSHESKQKRLSTRAETKIRSGESTSHSYLSIWAREVEAQIFQQPSLPAQSEPRLRCPIPGDLLNNDRDTSELTFDGFKLNTTFQLGGSEKHSGADDPRHALQENGGLADLCSIDDGDILCQPVLVLSHPQVFDTANV